MWIGAGPPSILTTRSTPDWTWTTCRARQRSRPRWRSARWPQGRADGESLLISRNGNDLTPTFPEVARAIRGLPYEGLVLDGEVVVHDEHGLPSFGHLQRRGRLQNGRDIARAAAERGPPALLRPRRRAGRGAHDEGGGAGARGNRRQARGLQVRRRALALLVQDPGDPHRRLRGGGIHRPRDGPPGLRRAAPRPLRGRHAHLDGERRHRLCRGATQRPARAAGGRECAHRGRGRAAHQGQPLGAARAGRRSDVQGDHRRRHGPPRLVQPAPRRQAAAGVPRGSGGAGRGCGGSRVRVRSHNQVHQPEKKYSGRTQASPRAT